jgi:LemA protein
MTTQLSQKVYNNWHMAVWIVLGIIILLVAAVFGMYNSLIVKKNRVKEAYSQIDVQLKRRSSLIPNLVEAVKGYMTHEREVLENVTQARSALMHAGNLGEAAKANDMLSGALKSLFAVAEAYPNLKASENFQQLQNELSDTETKVAASRQFYNTNVLDYNTSIQTVPTSILAGMFHFLPEQFFTATEAEKADVKVQF